MGNVFIYGDVFLCLLVFAMYDHDIRSYVDHYPQSLQCHRTLSLINKTYLLEYLCLKPMVVLYLWMQYSIVDTHSQARNVWLIYIHVCRTAVCVFAHVYLCVYAG